MIGTLSGFLAGLAVVPELAAIVSFVDVPLALGGVGDFLARLLQPDTLVRILLEGMGKAAIYFMIAVGLTLVFGLMGVLNFAHGAFAMLGAYVGGIVLVGTISAGSGVGTRLLLFVVAAGVVFAVMAAFGAAVETKLVRPIYDRPPTYQILLTFGIGLVLEELSRIVTTLRGIQPEPTWSAAAGTIPAVLEGSIDILQETLGINVRAFYLFAAAGGILVATAVWLFLTRTLYGLYIRAGSEDSEMVEALGVDVRRAFTVVFGIGTGLAALGGVFLTWDPTWGPSVLLNIDVLLFAFVVVVIGGLGSFKGTVAAALVVGVADSFTTWLFHTGIVTFPGLPEVTIFLLLVATLVVKPQGLYGVEEVGGH
ncbi:branched-chain amino acid ABC-type transport system, permease component [Halovivax ruber XH-70]|uniref:Branched-chain amino acid ABC-type transport system, permease component n=1 Tax=Halovivax ruber (strain DSM 18193 / JCM 13892 / XH-70) TaxID=797302 RepID=L0IFA0_HALRX|nr:branched-chain amino acid ABC transporter permease [Halovivax ruber]AGB16652.1 branched-chain amino acid ABC-type transport system, permease component [Halovivax ruber XH-70]